MNGETIIEPVLFFLPAGICAAGGGYLLWMALKNKQPPWDLFGAILPAACRGVATQQTAHFGRTYGGRF